MSTKIKTVKFLVGFDIFAHKPIIVTHNIEINYGTKSSIGQLRQKPKFLGRVSHVQSTPYVRKSFQGEQVREKSEE